GLDRGNKTPWRHGVDEPDELFLPRRQAVQSIRRDDQVDRTFGDLFQALGEGNARLACEGQASPFQPPAIWVIDRQALFLRLHERSSFAAKRTMADLQYLHRPVTRPAFGRAPQ